MALHNRKEQPKDNCEGIYAGDKFLCFKTVSFDKRPDDLIFKFGKVYESFHNGKIRDENGNNFHSFSRPFWTKHLVKLNEDGSADLSTAQDLQLGDKIMLAKLIKKHHNG